MVVAGFSFCTEPRPLPMRHSHTGMRCTQTHSKYTVDSVWENKYQLSIFIYEIKVLRLEMLTSQPASQPKPYTFVLCMRTYIKYTRRAFSSFFYRLKGLRHWFWNGTQFNSQKKFHFENGKTHNEVEQKDRGTVKKKSATRMRINRKIDKSIDRSTSIIK